MRIEWDSYIEEQLHWAECLSAIARESEGCLRRRLADYAERAWRNADNARHKQKRAGAH